jgi:hypothetical protein
MTDWTDQIRDLRTEGSLESHTDWMCDINIQESDWQSPAWLTSWADEHEQGVEANLSPPCDAASLQASFDAVIDTPGLLERMREARIWLARELAPFHPEYSTRPFHAFDEESGLSTYLELVALVDGDYPSSKLRALNESLLDWIADSESADVRQALVIFIERRGQSAV